MRLLYNAILLLFISAVIYSCSVPQQRGYPEHTRVFSNDKFYFDALIFFDTDSLKARLDLYVGIPSGKILFKKNEKSGKFEAKFQISVTIKTTDGELKIDKSFGESYEYTEEQMNKVSKETKYYLYNYYLEPANYKAEIKIKDIISNHEYAKSANFTVKDFSSREITFSDIMLLSDYKLNDDGTKEITPHVNNNIFGLNNFYMFFEIYNKNEDSVKKEYTYRIKDNMDNTLKEDVLAYMIYPGRSQKIEFVSIKNELKKIIQRESGFDFFPFGENEKMKFTLDIIDKSKNEIVTNKKLIFLPDKPPPKIQNRPRMH